MPRREKGKHVFRNLVLTVLIAAVLFYWTVLTLTKD